MKRRDKYLNEALAEMHNKNPNLEKAFELLKKSAEKNNPEALYAIGTWYLHGRLVKKNASLAFDFLLKAAEMNYPDAFYDLGMSYEKAVGVKRNYKKAFSCYLNASLLGDKQSLYEVGRCYYYGIGIAVNKDVGNIWLKHAELNGITW